MWTSSLGKGWTTVFGRLGGVGHDATGVGPGGYARPPDLESQGSIAVEINQRHLGSVDLPEHSYSPEGNAYRRHTYPGGTSWEEHMQDMTDGTGEISPGSSLCCTVELEEGAASILEVAPSYDAQENSAPGVPQPQLVTRSLKQAAGGAVAAAAAVAVAATSAVASAYGRRKSYVIDWTGDGTAEVINMQARSLAAAAAAKPSLLPDTGSSTPVAPPPALLAPTGTSSLPCSPRQQRASAGPLHLPPQLTSVLLAPPIAVAANSTAVPPSPVHHPIPIGPPQLLQSIQVGTRPSALQQQQLAQQPPSPVVGALRTAVSHPASPVVGAAPLPSAVLFSNVAPHSPLQRAIQQAGLPPPPSPHLPPSPAHVGSGLPAVPPQLQLPVLPQANGGGKPPLGQAPARPVVVAEPWGTPIVRRDSVPPKDSGRPRDGIWRLTKSQSMPMPRMSTIRFEELRILQQIGEGGFGKVYLGTWRSTQVAIKLANLQGSDKEQHQLAGEFHREVHTMSNIPVHPNVLRLLGACTDPPNLALVTEYCACGSLYYNLHASGDEAIPLPHLLSLCLGIARGMAHLHACHVLHRDLKSANLLLDDAGNIKICDFGLSRIVQEWSPMTGGLGTYQWMAPEVLAHQRYSDKADVYSFAIVMYELLTRQLPYLGMTAVQAAIGVVNYGLRPLLPPGVPPPLAALVSQCWAAVPDQRPRFDQIIESLTTMLDAAGAPQPAVPVQPSAAPLSSVRGTTAPAWMPAGVPTSPPLLPQRGAAAAPQLQHTGSSIEA